VLPGSGVSEFGKDRDLELEEKSRQCTNNRGLRRLAENEKERGGEKSEFVLRRQANTKSDREESILLQ